MIEFNKTIDKTKAQDQDILDSPNVKAMDNNEPGANTYIAILQIHEHQEYAV